MNTEAGRTAYVKCPNGHLAGIESHTIDDDGCVDPSVVCDGDGVTAGPKCGWHEFITLEGWSDQRSTRTMERDREQKPREPRHPPPDGLNPGTDDGEEIGDGDE
jgi:hypothetical protein